MLTRMLVLANVLVYVWESMTGAFSNNYIGGQDPFTAHGAINGVYVFGHHEYWRLITGAFLHGGLLHIALNMIALYQVGMFVETIMGTPRMGTVYFISMIAAGLSAAYFNYGEPVVGASGAIFGLFGALVAIGMRLGSRGRSLISQTLPIIVINLVFGFSIANVANSAHIGGLVAGFLSGLLLYHPPRPVAAYVVDAATGQPLESEVQTP